MKRHRNRRILLGVAALACASLAFVFIGLWAAQWVMSTDRLKTIVEEAASSFLQRRLTIGSVDRPGFPVTEIIARDVTLFERDGRPIAEAPEVRARASMLSFLKLRLGVEEMEFVSPRIHVRMLDSGRTNIERMVVDILARPRTTAQRSIGALVFHRFTVKAASATVTAVNGAPLVSYESRVDGHITLRVGPTGVWAPYEVDVDGGEGNVRAHVSGEIGSDPSVSVSAERLPAVFLAPRFAFLKGCPGTTDGRLSWRRLDGKNFFDFAGSPNGLCGGADVVLPAQVSGKIEGARSIWSVDLNVVGEKSHLKIAAKIPGAPEVARWKVTASRADATELLAWSSASSELFASSGPLKKSVAASHYYLDIATFTFGRLSFTDVDGEVHRSTEGVMRVAPVTAAIFGGSVEGLAEVVNGIITSTATGRAIDLQDAAHAFSSTSPLTGQLSFRFNGTGPSAGFAEHVRGTLSFSLENGKVPEVPAVIRAITSANLVKLEKEIKGEDGKGIVVTKGEGEALVNGQMLEVTRLLLDSRALRVGYTGKVEYVTKRVDGIVVLQPLNLADQIINDIPVLRTLVLGDNKTFLPLWFEVKGDWRDPRVRAMPQKNITQPIATLFRGLLKLPQEAIDRIRGKK